MSCRRVTGRRWIVYDRQERRTGRIRTRCFYSSRRFGEKTFLLGDAREIVPTLNENFDLVFIDADKESYSTYFDLVIDKLSSGGVILADNVLRKGKVLQDKKDKDANAIHSFNEKVSNDARVEQILLPIRDGILMIRKLSL